MRRLGRGCKILRGSRWIGEFEEGGGEDEPAQFTSDDGDGRDLYACHSNEAVLDKLLFPFCYSMSLKLPCIIRYIHISHLMTSLDTTISLNTYQT